MHQLPQLSRQLYPLSHVQTGIMAEMLQCPGNMHYNLPMLLDLPPVVDTDRLIWAMGAVVDAHPSWKTRFVRSDGQIMQYCDETIVPRVEVKDVEEDMMEELTDAFIRPFDPFGDVLFRFCLLRCGGRRRLLIDSCHLVNDGLSMVNYAREVGQVYDGAAPCGELESVFEHALRQREYDLSPRHEETSAYYRELYRDKDICGLNSGVSTAMMGRTIEEKIVIPRNEVDSFCEKEGCRQAALLNAAYAILLSAFTSSPSANYSTVLHGRDRKTRDTHGTFITTVPVLVELRPEESVSDLIRRVGLELVGVVRRSEYSFPDFVRTTGSIPDTMFVYQGPRISIEVHLGEVTVQARQLRVAESTDAALGITVYELLQGYELCCECSSARFSEEYIRTFARSYADVLHNVMANPSAPVSSIGTMPADQSAAMVEACTAAPSRGNGCATVCEAIARNVLLCPDKVAVESEGGTLTYARLDMEARIVASFLRSKNVERGDRVVFHTSRETRTIAAMLGIMRCGAAYIPIDPSYPREWIDSVMETAGEKFVLTDEILQELLRCGSADGPDDGSAAGYDDGSNCLCTPEDAAYLIYTSGTSGTPKAVVISHRALNAFACGIGEVLGLSASDRISCHSSFSFDASVEDIYPVLCAGGTLVLVPEGMRRDLLKLGNWLKTNKVTGGNYTTRLGQMLMESCDLSFLRYMVLGGEKMTLWPERARKTATFNTYGPTEFTVDATWHMMDASTNLDNIPIGRPLPGMCAVVADRNGNPLPAGVAGELVLSGDQIASGYLGREDLTQEKFRLGKLYPGGRYYRTGDVCRLNSAGELEYLRRMDNQVKINGFRIELQDIDNHVCAVPGVKEAKTAVLPSGRALCCYFTACEGVEMDGETLREALRKTLPAYMIPSVFMRLDAMPLGPGGKVDTTALPLPRTGEQVREDAFLSEVERKLLEIVGGVLGCRGIGADDDLVLHGLSSLQMMDVAVKAFACGIRLRMQDAAMCRSVRELAGCVETDDAPFWHNGDDKRPCACFFCGVTSLRACMKAVEALAEDYSVLVFPPVGSGSVQTAEDMVKGYVDFWRGRSDDVRMVCGHSFGGELAYMFACALARECGIRPLLVMLDTTFSLSLPRGWKALSGRLPGSLQLFLRCHDAAHLKGYDGRMLLFSALRRDEISPALSALKIKGLDAASNELRWRQSHPCIGIRSFDCGHEDILTSFSLDWRETSLY